MDDAYALGHADAEIERLRIQAGILDRTTRRFLKEAGVQPGMRALEIGCGAGDSAMLLADLVGEGGAVVATDREPLALKTARRRASEAGFANIEFVEASGSGHTAPAAFDVAFGRYVLVHQSDPSALVKDAASKVRQGGIVAFQEIALHIVSRALPRVELFDLVAEAIEIASRAALPNHDAAGRLVSLFMTAGLPAPSLIWESVAGGPSSALSEWAAMSFQAYWPHIQRLGLSPEVGDPNTLAQRLAKETAAVSAQIVSSPQAFAWSVRT